MKKQPRDCVLKSSYETLVYNADQQPQYYKKAIETGKYPKSAIENNAEDIYIAVVGSVIIALIYIVDSHFILEIIKCC